MENTIHILSKNPYIAAYPIEHKGIPRVRVDIPKEKELIRKIKTITGATFSGTKFYWHIPFSSNYLEIAKKAFNISSIPLEKPLDEADQGLQDDETRQKNKKPIIPKKSLQPAYR